MSDAIRSMLHPRSIAIVGASPDANKLNGRPFHYLRRDGFEGPLYPINPKYTEIDGIPCYPDVAALPEAPDLAIVAVSSRMAAEVVAALGQKGVAVAVVFSSGYAETGEAGARMEAELLAVARDNGIRLCGPNNLGLINAFDGVTATFSQYAYETPRPGPVAFASQSGAFGTGISALARSRGIGLGYFVNTGNQADITLIEVLDEILDDPKIEVVSAYLEGLRDGDQLVALAEKAMRLGKPLIITKVGRKSAGARAAASHTGSLAGEDRIFDAVLRQHGVIRARNEEHLLDLISAFSCCPIPSGRGIAMVTQSGGAGALMADRAEELGLDVPAPMNETRDRLKLVIPAFGATGNPIDVTGQFLAEPKILSDSVKFILEDRGVDVCVVWLQLMAGYAEVLVDIFRDIKASVEKPFIVCWLEAPEAAVQALRAENICVIGATERAVDAAAGLIEYGTARQRLAGAEPPPPRPSVKASAGPPAAVPSMAAAALLAEAGIKLAEAMLATTAEAASQAAAELGYPVAVKIESPDILHKTEADGVRLGLADADAVVEATTAVLAAARAHSPDARIAGVLVERMLTPATELVLGIRRDAIFGPVVMVGLGGIFIEVLDDVAFSRAPVTPAAAALMLDNLKFAVMLDGVRGRAAVDRAALIDAICKLSAFAILHPELVELDLNPVFAGPDGVIAVDWLMLTDSEEAAG